MAVTAYSITVTQNVNVFGGGPASLWNAWNWNAFKWGQGTADVPQNIRHLVSDSVTATASVKGFRVVHRVSDSFSATDSVNYRFHIQMLDLITPVAAASTLELQDPNGYFRYFPEDVINAAQSTVPTWSQTSSAAVSWTTATVAATSWS